MDESAVCATVLLISDLHKHWSNSGPPLSLCVHVGYSNGHSVQNKEINSRMWDELQYMSYADAMENGEILHPEQ